MYANKNKKHGECENYTLNYMDKRNISVSNRSTNVARTVFVSPP
jgi:hypothetical protein